MAFWSRKAKEEKAVVPIRTLEQMASEASIKIGKPGDLTGYGNGTLEPAPGVTRIEASQNLIKLAKKCGVTYIDEVTYSEGPRVKVTAKGYALKPKQTETANRTAND